MIKYILLFVIILEGCKVKQNSENCISAISQIESKANNDLNTLGGYIVLKFNQQMVDSAYTVLKKKILSPTTGITEKSQGEKLRALIDRNYETKCTTQFLPLNNTTGLNFAAYTAQHCFSHIYFAIEAYAMLSVKTKNDGIKYIKVPMELNLLKIKNDTMRYINPIHEKYKMTAQAKYGANYFYDFILGYFSTRARLNSSTELLRKQHASKFDPKNNINFEKLSNKVFKELNLKETTVANYETSKELTLINFCSIENRREFTTDSNDSLNCFVTADMISVRGKLIPQSNKIQEYLTKKFDNLRQIKSKLKKQINSDIFDKWEKHSILLDENAYTLNIRNSIIGQLVNCEYNNQKTHCKRPDIDTNVLFNNIAKKMSSLKASEEYNRQYELIVSDNDQSTENKEDKYIDDMNRFIFYKNYVKTVLYQELLKISKAHNLLKSASLGTNNLKVVEERKDENIVNVQGFENIATKNIAKHNYSPFYFRPYGVLYFQNEGKVLFDKTDSGSTINIGGVYPVSVLSSYNNVDTSGGFTQVQLPAYDEKTNVIDEDILVDNKTTVDGTNQNQLDSGCSTAG